MKILAVTCYTGGAELCEMTREMVDNLVVSTCDLPRDHKVMIRVLAQGANNCSAFYSYGVMHVQVKENVGFAYGMNTAIENGLSVSSPDYVLCLNNDLQFPNHDWLKELLKEASPNHITVPATDLTAVHHMPQKVAMRKPSFFTDEMSAYAWLIPFKWCQWLKETHGFWLFSEDFAPAYGEDNWTTLLLRQKYGDMIFRVVPKAWIRHLRKKTSSVVKHDRSKTSKVLADKCRGLLAQGNLSRSLRQKTEWFLKVLKC